MQDCPTCGESYERLGQHFAFSKDHRPDLTNHQRSIVEYLILCGAQVRENTSRPSLVVYGTDEDRLTDVSQSLGYLSNGLRIHEDSADAAARLQKTHGSERIQFEEDNIEDIWILPTVPHPAFENYNGGDAENNARQVTQMSVRTLSLLALDIGDVEQYSIFPTVHFDTRNCAVPSEHFQELLHAEGIQTLPRDGSTLDSDVGNIYHSNEDVVSVPYPSSMELLDILDLDLQDISKGPIKLGHH